MQYVYVSEEIMRRKRIVYGRDILLLKIKWKQRHIA